MIDYNCRYIGCNAICTLTGDYCTNCTKSNTMKYKYKSTIDPFKNTTEISILNNRGHKYMTVEIYGQLTETAIRSYAIDMLQILSKKGVIK